MLIIGAKGFAKEVLEVLHQLGQLDDVVFYDDVSETLPELLYGRFPVLRTKAAASDYFKTIDARFVLGIGQPVLRRNLARQFEAMGGVLTSVVSPFAQIGHFGNDIGTGCSIMTNALISNDVQIGSGCIVYFNAIITHDCKIGDFVEFSPGATILGRCKIGSFSQIGSNVTILPNVSIGDNVVIGAGSVVTKDIPSNSLAVGVPAVIKKELPKLIF